MRDTSSATLPARCYRSSASGQVFEFRLSGLEISKYYNNISSTNMSNRQRQ